MARALRLLRCALQPAAMAASGFRKPLGPLAVSFADFEVSRTAWLAWDKEKWPAGMKEASADIVTPAARLASIFDEANLLQVSGKEKDEQSDRLVPAEADGKQGAKDGLGSSVATGESDFVSSNDAGNAAKTPACVLAEGKRGKDGSKVLPPLVRVFYPADVDADKESFLWRARQWSRRRWLPHFMYAVGFAMVAVKPTSFLKKLLLWLLAAGQWSYAYGATIPAWIKQPLAGDINADDTKDGDTAGVQTKLPVCVLSHGLWGVRTTYTALACDLASHGYVVVCVEHRDGSAGMTQYTEEQGKGRLRRSWLPHVHLAYNKNALRFRNRQLQQRIAEVQSVLDLLEALNRGALAPNANVAEPGLALDPRWLAGRLDLDQVAVVGHSFGAATATAVAGVEPRCKAAVALDVWSEAWAEEEFKRHGGSAPLLLVQSESFDWKNLRETRNRLLQGRSDASIVTEKYTIKGTTHHHQSDFPLVAPRLIKLIRMAGSIDPNLAQDCSSQVCLDFLAKHVLTSTPGAAPAGLQGGLSLEKVQHLLIPGKLGRTEMQGGT